MAHGVRFGAVLATLRIVPAGAASGCAGALDLPDVDHLQAMIDRGDCTIVRRARPYVLPHPLRIPGSRTVDIEPGALFDYTGPTGSLNALAGAFEVIGDDVTIAVTGGTAVFAPPRPRRSCTRFVPRARTPSPCRA